MLVLVLLMVLWEGGCGLDVAVTEENTPPWSSSKSPWSTTLASPPPPPMQDCASSSSNSFCRLSVSTCLLLRFSSRTRSISTKSSCICSTLKINRIHTHVYDRYDSWGAKGPVSPVSDQVSVLKKRYSSSFSLKTASAPGAQLVMFSTAFHAVLCMVSGCCFFLHTSEKYTVNTLPWGKSVRNLSLCFWNPTTKKERHQKRWTLTYWHHYGHLTYKKRREKTKQRVKHKDRRGERWASSKIRSVKFCIRQHIVLYFNMSITCWAPGTSPLWSLSQSCCHWWACRQVFGWNQCPGQRCRLSFSPSSSFPSPPLPRPPSSTGVLDWERGRNGENGCET